MQELARAKVNLSLHITGKRDDGYHLLDSLVVFPDVGDVLHQTAQGFRISGPFAEGLSREDNLVLRAAALSGVKTGFHLEKNLPVASGIGGGSADAAAALRLLSCGTVENGLALGADVPACILSKPLRMQGIGAQLTLLPPLPEFAIILVNAGVPVSTAQVFSAISRVDNAPSPALEFVNSQRDFFAFVAAQRNDMQVAATNLCPVIAEVLEALSAQPNCALARMSGSGGTCFGMFENLEAARNAAEVLKKAQPSWWVAAARA